MTSIRSYKNVVLVTCTLALVVLVVLVLMVSSTIIVPPPDKNRPLANMFLTLTYNWEEKRLWSASPEVVTSILWDYRGLDTVYETTVFFLAIIGSLMLVRNLEVKPGIKWKGMSVIARTITKITLATIPVVAASIALHGHLTPGGGFQGGSVFAVATLLAIVALGTGFMLERGWSKQKLLGLRTLGLLFIIVVITLIPLIGFFNKTNAYIMQNQWKPWAPIGYGYVLNLLDYKILYSGSLLLLNLAEFLAVSTGLTLVFLVLGLPTRLIEKGGGVVD